MGDGYVMGVQRDDVLGGIMHAYAQKAPNSVAPIALYGNTIYNIVAPNGTIIISSGSTKGVWAWDAARGMRQLLDASSGVYGLSSAADVDGGCLLGGYAGKMYYYDCASDALTAIATDSSITNIIGIAPMSEGGGYWLLMQYYYYYNPTSTTTQRTYLYTLTWPGKVATQKICANDYGKYGGLICAVPGGCVLTRQYTDSDSSTFYITAYNATSNTLTDKATTMGSAATKLVCNIGDVYYVSYNDTATTMAAYNAQSKAWATDVTINSGVEKMLAENSAKRVYAGKYITKIDKATGAVTDISGDCGAQLSWYQLDADTYLLWTYSANKPGLWRYKFSTDSWLRLDNNLSTYGWGNPVKWRSGCLWTQGVIAYYNQTADALTVYATDKCGTSGPLSLMLDDGHTVCTISGGSLLCLYDLDAATQLKWTSQAITYNNYTTSFYGIYKSRGADGKLRVLIESYNYSATNKYQMLLFDPETKSFIVLDGMASPTTFAGANRGRIMFYDTSSYFMTLYDTHRLTRVDATTGGIVD